MTGEDINERLDELESLVEHQRERIEEQSQQIKEQAERIDELTAGTDSRVGTEQIGTEPDSTPKLVPSGGQTHKVMGKFSDSNGGVGVYGHNTASSGTTYGVWGEVNSDSGYGLYTPNDARIDGETAIGAASPVTTLHVKDSVAETGGDNLGRHVAAIENTNSNTSSPIPDVLGLELTNVTDPGEFHSYISFMDDTGTIGNIQGNGNGGVEFNGTLPNLDTTNTGLLAELSSDQTISDATGTVVKFTNSKKDDFGGLDTSTGKYTVQVAGDYHVTTAIRWLDRLAGGTNHYVYIIEERDGNSSFAAQRSREVPGASSEDAYVHEHLSKTVYDLSQGDKIWIEVRHQFGDSSEDITDSSYLTYLTIDKVG